MRTKGARLERLDLSDRHLSEAVWIDLETPTDAEEDAVEAALGIDIPTREDMQEIEVSSRIYREGGALFLTAQVVASHEVRDTEIGPVTFVVLPEKLVTIHYHHPGSLDYFADWAARHDTHAGRRARRASGASGGRRRPAGRYSGGRGAQPRDVVEGDLRGASALRARPRRCRRSCNGSGGPRR